MLDAEAGTKSADPLLDLILLTLNARLVPMATWVPVVRVRG